MSSRKGGEFKEKKNAMMEALLEKERELQRLNAELDEKQRKLSAASAGSSNPTTGCSPNPRKKLSVSASGRGGKGARPRCGSLLESMGQFNLFVRNASRKPIDIRIWTSD